MDYSTISNKTSCTEIEEVTNGELSERYYLLKKQFESLSITFEATKQELHDTKRSYQTALDIQRHLTAELEGHQAEEEKRRQDLQIRIVSLQEEISLLREDRVQTAESHAIEVKKFETEIQRLKEQNNTKVHRASPEKDPAELEEARAALANALHELALTKQTLENSRADSVSWRLKAEEMVSEMQEIKAASEIRREELKAANERETVALAELTLARSLLHQFTDSQDLQPHAAKGNSLFAEVEDKRQEMAKNLIQMKQTNSRLRRELANKQAELETLLHEKQNVWEQQAGASAHFDREMQESYEERITQLEGHCERQRRELAKWFSKQCEPTAQGWLSGVLDHLKSECEQLRAEVLSRGAAQLASAAQIRELRRKIALLTANGAKISNSPKPIELNVTENKTEIGMPKVSVQIKSKTPDEVKKKVSFN